MLHVWFWKPIIIKFQKFIILFYLSAKGRASFFTLPWFAENPYSKEENTPQPLTKDTPRKSCIIKDSDEVVAVITRSDFLSLLRRCRPFFGDTNKTPFTPTYTQDEGHSPKSWKSGFTFFVFLQVFIFSTFALNYF